MPRQTKTVADRLRDLYFKFPKRTDYKFLYKKRSDLQRKYSTVQCYFVIYSPDMGHSLMVWNPHRRGFNWRAKEWNTWLREKGLDIYVDAVLPAINEKNVNRADWIMREYVGFHGDIYEPTAKPLEDKKGR